MLRQKEGNSRSWKLQDIILRQDRPKVWVCEWDTDKGLGQHWEASISSQAWQVLHTQE